MRTMTPLALCALAFTGCLGNDELNQSDAGYSNADFASISCSANNDGVIERSELPLAIGVTAKYLQNPSGTLAMVNPVGQDSPDGPAWDLTSEAGDAVSLPIVAVTGTWFASSFPGATYATYTDLATKTYGVFKLTDSALQLMGYASEAPNQTLLVYDVAIDTIRFPLKKGDSWVQVATITNGKFDGLPVAEKDTYKVSVDEQGVAVLPFLRVTKTLRIHVELDQSVGTSTHSIQYLFFRECVGEVGRMVSAANETDENFTSAATFRRLAL